MSNTPRVDEELQRLNDAIRAGEKCGDVAEAYAWEFARQLEKELAEARGEIERKDKLIEQMRDALTWALTEARSTHGEQLIRAALRAAMEANR